MNARWAALPLLLLLCLPAAADAVPDLARKLKDPDAATRQEAARSLGRMGPNAADAIPDLEAALEDDDEAVRLAAAWALERIRPKSKGRSAAELAKRGRELYDSVGPLYKKFVFEHETVTDEELEKLTDTYEEAVSLFSRALEIEYRPAYDSMLRRLSKRSKQAMFVQIQREGAKRRARR
ncbi:MAG: HEAT repeat domain-containing protein, partial [Planctomycetota bacterium]